MEPQIKSEKENRKKAKTEKKKERKKKEGSDQLRHIVL